MALTACSALLAPAHADEAAVAELQRLFAQNWQRLIRAAVMTTPRNC